MDLSEISNGFSDTEFQPILSPGFLLTQIYSSPQVLVYQHPLLFITRLLYSFDPDSTNTYRSLRQSRNQAPTGDAESAAGSRRRKEGGNVRWHQPCFPPLFSTLVPRLNFCTVRLDPYSLSQAASPGKVNSNSCVKSGGPEAAGLGPRDVYLEVLSNSSSAIVEETEGECVSSLNRMTVSYFKSPVCTFYLCVT